MSTFEEAGVEEINRYTRKGGRKIGAPNPKQKAPVRSVIEKGKPSGKRLVASNYAMTEHIGNIAPDPAKTPKPESVGPVAAKTANAAEKDEYGNITSVYPANKPEKEEIEEIEEIEAIEEANYQDHRRSYMEDEEDIDDSIWEWDLGGDIKFGKNDMFPDVLEDMDMAANTGDRYGRLRELESQRTMAIANGLPSDLYEDFVLAGYMPDRIDEENIYEALREYYADKLTIAIKSGKYSIVEIKRVKDLFYKYITGTAKPPAILREYDHENLLKLFEMTVKTI